MVFSKVTIQKLWLLVATPKQFSVCYYSLGRAAVLLPEEQKEEGGDTIRKTYSGDGKMYCHSWLSDLSGAVFFVLNCKKVLCLGLVYFFKSSHEEQEEQAVGQQSAFAQTYSHPVLPCARCLTGNFEASARGACLSHTCVITGQCPTTGKIGEIPILSV